MYPWFRGRESAIPVLFSKKPNPFGGFEGPWFLVKVSSASKRTVKTTDPGPHRYPTGGPPRRRAKTDTEQIQTTDKGNKSESGGVSPTGKASRFATETNILVHGMHGSTRVCIYLYKKIMYI